MAACDPTTLVAEGKCFQCENEKQFWMTVIALLCNISSGGGGGAGVTCGVADPVAAPSGTCGLYYRTDNGAFWFWNGAAWVQFIAP